VHVREQAADFKRLGERFSAQWTPTTLVIDHTGTERHRVEGFLPADDLLAELTLGLGHSAFARSEFPEAEQRFREVLDRFPNSEVAAEAQYWAGVSRYKATNDAAALGETARQFTQRFQDSTWAKKASVWAK
jgi:outer membrane protein assembly factor BamD (BamD/ComL family)